MREIRSSLLVPALLVSIAGGSLRAASEQSAPVAPLAKTEDRSMESARKLISEGKYSEAKTELSAIVAEDQQQRGPQDFQTMADRLELAIAEGKLNRSLEAETEMRTLLAIFVRRCGPDHDETLRCRGALAQLLTDTARPTEAVKEYRQILDSRERMLGDDDLEVARVRHLLGDALAVAGGYVEAIQQYHRSGEIFEKMLGAENAETLLNRFTAALAQGENAEFAAAEKELKDILAIRERLFGPHDLSVLRTCYQLGRVLGGDKQYEEALVYATRAANGLGAVFEPDNRVVLQVNGLCEELRSDLARLKSGTAAQ